jgi:hypothetical protein
MIKRVFAAAAAVGLLAAAPASASDGHSIAGDLGAGIMALGLTAAFLGGHTPPPVIYPIPPLIALAPPPIVYARPPVVEPFPGCTYR